MQNEENVNHPKHYTECSIECIDAMIIAFGVEAVVNFCKCNAFKYLWRYKNKNGLEDLQKARWYCSKADSLIDSEDKQLVNLMTIVGNCYYKTEKE